MLDAHAPAASPPALLVSGDVARDHGERLLQEAGALGVPLRLLVAPVATHELAAITAAFFSRELYEGSSLRLPGARSNAFFAMVDAAPKLRWLHVCSAGLDLPQYQPSLARGVRVTGSGGAAAVPIAQTAAAAVLAQSRGFDHWLAAQSSGRWAPLTGAARPRELHSLRALIVGTGPIGQEIARLLRAVGMHTTGVRRQATPAPGFDATLPLGRLDEALPRTDWLILALPLSPDTQGLIDARRLALLPPGARLANVARGELLDEPALVDALARGRLAGAYLDVFGVEPLPADSPLWSMPGVWITPHNSAASQGHEARVVERFVHELRRWLAAGEAFAPHDNARRPT